MDDNQSTAQQFIPIAVSLLTGFLGAGKTTVLNGLLQDQNMSNTALIINEFGDVGIDHLLVETADESVVELSNGCLCCTIRGDLVDTLSRLLSRNPRPDRILIETTGLADPAPVLHAIMGHPGLSENLRLDGVITVVDAVNGMATLDDHEEAVKQVAVADRIIISKTDLEDDIEKVTSRIVRLNPHARILSSKGYQPNANDLLNCGLFDPTTKTIDIAQWLHSSNQGLDHTHQHNHDDGHHHHDVNRHDSRIRAFTLKSDKAVSALALSTFIDLLQSAHGPNLLRVKGVIKLVEDPKRPVVLHGVQQIFHPPATLPDWPDEDQSTRMVFITKDMSADFVTKLFNALVGQSAIDTPDNQALVDNPLAAPGFTSR